MQNLASAPPLWSIIVIDFMKLGFISRSSSSETGICSITPKASSPEVVRTDEARAVLSSEFSSKSKPVVKAILITSNGAWKLGGFGFTISTDQSSNVSASSQPFHYAEYDVEDSILLLQPSINYTAPELVRIKTSSVGPASDIFSFGCLAFHLIARKPLFDCHNNVKMVLVN